jgi:hypothetical protein
VKKNNRLYGLIIGLILFIIHFISFGQVTIFPEIERRTDESVQIIKIEVTDIFTIIDMFYIAIKEDAWICADKNYYIQPTNSNERKYLIMAKDIPLCPDRKKIHTGDEEFKFQLYFPGIDTSVRKIDVIEKPVSGFNFFGVWLDTNDERALPDSLLLTSREEFQSWFENREEPLKQMEGIWKLTANQAKYQGEIFIEYMEEEPEISDVALIWENDEYHCYGMDGKSLEISFSVIAEGGRFAYKEYFRDVKEEVTTFIYTEELMDFEVRFNVPRRWARYQLSGKIFDNQDLVKIMSWEKMYPETLKE